MAEKFKHKFSLVFSSGSARIVELIQLQILAVFFVSLNIGCSYPKELHPVTVKEFSKFVSETNYKTDAEKFGWSFVQSDVLNYDVVSDVNWRVPNGIDSSNYDLPVTQVSYNDAMAFCKWASAKLPDYEEYWKYSQGDQRKIISNAEGIYTVLEVNIIGNVWDITSSKKTDGEIRLAGGSYLCSPRTCDGTSPQRQLFVDKETGNSHIGFSVIR